MKRIMKKEYRSLEEINTLIQTHFLQKDVVSIQQTQLGFIIFYWY